MSDHNNIYKQMQFSINKNKLDTFRPLKLHSWFKLWKRTTKAEIVRNSINILYLSV